MTDEITLLLALQGKDRQYADLVAQMKRLESQNVQLEQTQRDEQEAVEKLRQNLKQLEHTSRLRNLEVDDLDMQIRNYQKHLDEGIISFKEMEALRTKIVQQKERISQMEDEALALMDEIETTRVHVAQAEAKLAEREQQLAACCKEILSRIAQLKAQITQGQRERAEVTVKIRAHLLHHYEKLHAEYDDPVVAILDGTCSGCKLRVSGNTIERARSGMEITTCENCSRILYVN